MLNDTVIAPNTTANSPLLFTMIEEPVAIAEEIDETQVFEIEEQEEIEEGGEENE